MKLIGKCNRCKNRIRTYVVFERRRKVEEMAEFSPMMQHYLATKEKYKDCILFYRLGDFYEMFFDDAVNVSQRVRIDVDRKRLWTR